jgi:hypothetical protein
VKIIPVVVMAQLLTVTGADAQMKMVVLIV